MTEELPFCVDTVMQNYKRYLQDKGMYKVKLDGTRFFFDIVKQELRQVNNPANKIKFDDLPYDDELCYLYYDTRQKTMYKGNIEMDISKLPRHVKVIGIPHDAIEGKTFPAAMRFVPKNNTKEERDDIKRTNKHYLQFKVLRQHRKRHRL